MLRVRTQRATRCVASFIISRWVPSEQNAADDASLSKNRECTSHARVRRVERLRAAGTSHRSLVESPQCAVTLSTTPKSRRAP